MLFQRNVAAGLNLLARFSPVTHMTSSELIQGLAKPSVYEQLLEVISILKGGPKLRVLLKVEGRLQPWLCPA